MHLDKLKRQLLRQHIQHRPGRTITCVDHHPEPAPLLLRQSPHGIHINIPQQMLNIFRQDIINTHTASFTSHLLLQHGRLPAAQFFQLPQSAVLRHRPGTTSDQLKAVIGLGIVAGRNHDAPIQLQMSSSKINHLRAALADIHHITARFRQPFNKGFL